MDGAEAIGNIVAVLEELRIDRASVNGFAIADGAQRLLCQPARPLELRGGSNAHRTPHEIRSVTPECGEHTDEILRELGYKDGDIADLHKRNVV